MINSTRGGGNRRSHFGQYAIILTASLLLLNGGDVYARKKGAEMQAVTGFEAVAKPEYLPLLHPPGTKKNRQVSYDACGGNGFGFFQTMFKKYVDENQELVFFDAFGPGCLYREQMNIWTNNGVGVNDKQLRIKFYFDGEDLPRIDVPVWDFFHGDSKPFGEPFMFRDGRMFGIGYYPFSFAKRLKITLTGDRVNEILEKNEDPSCNWHQFDYLTYNEDTEVKTWSEDNEDFKDVALRQWSNLGVDPKEIDSRNVSSTFSLAPGQEFSIFRKSGKAAVSGISLELNPFDEATFCNTYLRIRWDNQTVPAVDMPLSYFFGAGGWKDGIWSKSLKNLMFGFDASKHTMYAYWPMPFFKKAEISIVNKSSKSISNIKSRIDWIPSSVLPYPKGKVGYFMAKLTEDVSKTGGLTRKDFQKPFAVAFKEKGWGHVVGVNMFSGNFYEDGDEFTFIDGSRTAHIHGDGTEDDFNQGWAGGRHQKALWGSLDNGVKGSYRLHMNEPYIFYDDINMTFEYTNSIYRGDSPRKRNGTDPEHIETEFVIWYYKSPVETALVMTDSIDVAKLNDEAAHGFVVEGKKRTETLTQTYDSYENADDWCVVTDDGRAFNGSAEFVAKLDPDNKGVRIRTRINRMHNGRQLATVYVDGEKLETPWSVLTYSDQPRRGSRSFDGWYDVDFEIHAKYTEGKKSIKVKMEHASSVAGELNAFHYWVYCYTKSIF